MVAPTFVAMLALLAAMVLVACANDSQRAERALREADRVAADEGHEEALSLYDDIVATYPGTDAAERARQQAVLYRGLDGAVDRFPVHRARDLIVDAGRRVERFRVRSGRLPSRLAEVFGDGGPPLDPWGRPFEYRRLRDGRSYELSSRGADGAPGGDGPDADLVVRDGEFVEGGP